MAATLGQLGIDDACRKAAIELLAFKEDSSKRGRRLINNFVKLQEITERILEGLKQVGLKVE